MNDRSADRTPDDLNEPTIETVVGDASSVRSHDRPRIALVAGSGPRLSLETANLLRARLRVSAALLLAATLFFMVRSWLGFSGGMSTESSMMTAYRILVLAILSISVALLWSRSQLSGGELRAIELAVFGILCTYAILVNVRSLERIGDLPGLYEVEYRVYTILLMWYALVLIYGIFIPNTLLRGGTLIGIMCLTPVVLIAVKAWLTPAMGEVVIWNDLTVSVITMSLAFTTAVYGMYKVGALRREAFEARQLGQYRLTERIGAGGMGEVYLAEHQLLKRPCAIKLVQASSSDDSRALARFEREVRLMAKLSHWNSVEVFDYGRTDDGTFYYAMEFLPGLSLQEVVERQGPLQPERAVHLLRQVCNALTEAHGTGLVHRDIKPSNIIASKRGGILDVAKLLDFGLATSTDDMQEIRLTQEGAIAGSPYYLAPERFLDNIDTDVRIDIYSLGAVSYFLLTGRPPFRDELPLQVMVAHARKEVEPPSKHNRAIPADLERVILKCLSKRPSDRFPDAASLERALADCACADQWTQEVAAVWWTDRELPSNGPTDFTTSPMIVSVDAAK